MHRLLLVSIPPVAMALCLYAVELPLYVEAPGHVRSILPLIDIDGVPTYDADGRLLLTTVNVGRANLYDAFRAWLDRDAHVVPERAVLPPGQTDREYDLEARSAMDQSKIAAVAVAFEELSDYPDDHAPGVIVQDVVEGAPAEGVLFPGDLITEVDGEPLAGMAQLRRLVTATQASRRLVLTVRPLDGGETRTVPVRPALLEGADRPLIGIAIVANFPFDVRIASGNIAGPSAGLMWAVGVTELLTPGELIDGRQVAGTGTVDLAGNVGPIGGIGLKVLAAQRAGADLFLVPEDNLAEARGAAAGIELVPISSVAEAISALESR